MTALFVDLGALAAIGAFAWAGTLLGLRRAALRLASLGGAALFVLALRDGVAGLVERVTPASTTVASAIAVVVVAVASWFALSRLIVHVLEWRGVDEEGGDPRLGAIPGAVLGLGWALLFVAILVLLPRDDVVSRAAVRSVSGGTLIRHDTFLHWLANGFPSLTQPLPKGRTGAVVGPIDGALPIQEHRDPTGLPEDGRDMAAFIARARSEQAHDPLARLDPLSEFAQEHARDLVRERRLGRRTQSGQRLDSDALASLGSAGGAYAERVGIEVVWATSPANAFAALEERRTSRLRLLDPRWSGIGVGAADAGWFDGRIYVIILVEARDPAGAEDGGATARDDDGAATEPVTPPVVAPDVGPAAGSA